ncbi:MAG: 50S ribosomal protein L4 [Ignavibacteria bacterium]|nr:50S ribosomal protein L4 [Ignavibacteria bacterium]MBT8383990.1 50S ribosomal protein L4 [Ignavibacteria bacterium]MBT8392055.1 50S ribosomal protein L4 [Ignavibacteria bacterium]NNJ54058.1 50S ribosomal protein L4 [Ignavibacteriaceae bacterium]NNL20982.1 50S ribosomal protein L4 [Ignavibacteriaceae bacterium]
MKIDIYKIDGKTSGEKIELADDIFGIEPKDHVLYLAVKAYLANQRQGTHKAKERSEVRGGGRKPWRQKGRGTARAGTTRSPIWTGGGTTFGPRPRDYTQKLPRKVKQLARKSALSSKAKEKQIIVVEDFTFEQPKTKEFASILNSFDLNGKKVLLLTGKTDKNVYKSGRNIPKVNIMEASKASTYNILNNQLLMLQKSAVEELTKPFRQKAEVVN